MQHGLSAGGSYGHILHATLLEQPLHNALQLPSALILQCFVKVLDIVVDHRHCAGQPVFEMSPRVSVQVRRQRGEEPFRVGLALVIQRWHLVPMAIVNFNGIIGVADN